jgi:GTPase SAR1 family protein
MSRIKMHLWDTAGQEKFFSLTKMYVQDAVGVILVYDMTSIESL